MRLRSFSALFMLALAGCPGGDGSIGDSCTSHSDCSTALQCVTGTCVAKCKRAPDCGDGFACDQDGFCHSANGQAGDRCTSEVQCSAGLSCQLGDASDAEGHLVASCSEQNPTRPAGAVCAKDAECRNGTCALGRCVDLCRETRDCGSGTACIGIPRVEADGVMFDGCIPPTGSIAWSIPVSTPSSDTILVPIPDTARSATIVFQVDDQAQRVGARQVIDPSGATIYQKPCEPAITPGCTPETALDQYYAQPVRHLPDFGQSVLQLPSTPDVANPLEPGAYRIAVSSFRANGATGSSVPHVTALVKMDVAVFLDLHFHFLDLEDHPCQSAFGGATLDAASAKDAPFFQNDFLGGLNTIFAGGGIALGDVTLQDINDHADLDGLSVENAGSLLALGQHDTGIDVYFVRTLSPVGLQAFGPNPGPAGLRGTRQSGIVIGVDTLCYRSWTQLARLTAHELARYMGLYHNVELEVHDHATWRDPIADSNDASSNLMFFSEIGGITLSAGQREILKRSAVLR
jgi:hypothetical protein